MKIPLFPVVRRHCYCSLIMHLFFPCIPVMSDRCSDIPH